MSRVAWLLALVGCAVGSEENPTDAGPGGAGDPVDWEDVTPLSDDELAYMTYTDGSYDTIRVIDVTTGESRVLSDLEGDGFGLSAIAMAPDRRSVAFAAYFRMDEAGFDPAAGLPHPGIWRVDASGADYQMIAPPLQQMESSTSCSSDAECAPLGMECNLVFETCQLEAATFLTDDLAFSPSGDELWFSYGTYWLDGYELAGGSTLASVPSVPGTPATVPEIHLSDASCAQVSDPTVEPDGSAVLALRSVCLSGRDDGIFRYALPDMDAKRAIPTPDGFDITLTSPDGFPDGHGFVFVVNGGWDEDGDGEVDWYSDGLVQWDAETDEVSLITAMPEGFSILDPSVSPDGTKVAMCVTGAGSDLYLVDLEAWTMDPLTEHGASCKPSW